MSIKDKIRDVEGPDLKETMQDQIRQWFIECRLVNDDNTLDILYRLSHDGRGDISFIARSTIS